MEPSGELSASEFWSAVQDDEERIRQSAADRPLFAPARWISSVALGEWAFGAGPRELMHGSPREDAQEPLRRRVLVDDSWVEFDLWEDDTRWWAAAETPREGIALHASNLDPAALALVRVNDVEPYLCGRTVLIQRQRGEA